MKVKYTWELMHGDADQYDHEEIILEDDGDIALFDFIISLDFNEDGIICDEELFELLKKSKTYKEYDEDGTRDCDDTLNDILRDWDYYKNDLTAGGDYYATVTSVDREELVDHPIKVKYKNWKNEITIRTIIPQNIYYGSTKFHKTEQWLMDVWDIEKDALRTYAMMDIIEFIKED